MSLVRPLASDSRTSVNLPFAAILIELPLMGEPVANRSCCTRLRAARLFGVVVKAAAFRLPNRITRDVGFSRGKRLRRDLDRLYRPVGRMLDLNFHLAVLAVIAESAAEAALILQIEGHAGI